MTLNNIQQRILAVRPALNDATKALNAKLDRKGPDPFPSYPKHSPRRQHSIPEFWLKSFASNPQVVILNHQNRPVSATTEDTQDATVGRNTYTFTDAIDLQDNYSIETFFAWIENDAALGLRKLGRGQQITPVERLFVCYLIAVQSIRTARYRDMISDTVAQIEEKRIAFDQLQGAIPKPEAPLRVELPQDENREYLAGVTMHALQTVLNPAFPESLFARRWCRCKAADGNRWALPLDPVIADSSILASEQIWVPINRDYMLRMDWGATSNELEILDVQLDQRATAALHLKIVNAYHEMIVHPDDAAIWQERCEELLAAMETDKQCSSEGISEGQPVASHAEENLGPGSPPISAPLCLSPEAQQLFEQAMRLAGCHAAAAWTRARSGNAANRADARDYEQAATLTLEQAPVLARSLSEAVRHTDPAAVEEAAAHFAGFHYGVEQSLEALNAAARGDQPPDGPTP